MSLRLHRQRGLEVHQTQLLHAQWFAPSQCALKATLPLRPRASDSNRVTSAGRWRRHTLGKGCSEGLGCTAATLWRDDAERTANVGTPCAAPFRAGGAPCEAAVRMKRSTARAGAACSVRGPPMLCCALNAPQDVISSQTSYHKVAR